MRPIRLVHIRTRARCSALPFIEAPCLCFECLAVSSSFPSKKLNSALEVYKVDSIARHTLNVSPIPLTESLPSHEAGEN